MRELVSSDGADIVLWRRSLGAASEKIGNRQLMRVIDGCLTPKQRAYVYAYYFEGRNMYKIAEERGVAVSTVSRTLSRARKRIFEALKYCMRS